MIFASVQCWFRMSNPIIYICIIQQRYDRLKFYESYNKYEVAFYTLKLVRFTFVNNSMRAHVLVYRVPFSSWSVVSPLDSLSTVSLDSVRNNLEHGQPLLWFIRIKPRSLFIVVYNARTLLSSSGFPCTFLGNHQPSRSHRRLRTSSGPQAKSEHGCMGWPCTLVPWPQNHPPSQDLPLGLWPKSTS